MIRARSLSGLAVVVATAWLHASAAWAQGPPATAGVTTTPFPVGALPRFDVGGTVGWFSQKAGDGTCCRWYNDSLWMGVEGGYYWTEHLKTEVGFAATTDGETYSGGDQVPIGGTIYSQWSQARVRTRRFTAVQVYQFGHNAWVHPFVGVGVNVVREDRREERYLYALSPYTSGSGRTELLATSQTVLRGSALVGMKAYVSKRAYFRTDLLLGFRTGVDEVVLRCGFGVDF